MRYVEFMEAELPPSSYTTAMVGARRDGDGGGGVHGVPWFMAKCDDGSTFSTVCLFVLYLASQAKRIFSKEPIVILARNVRRLCSRDILVVKVQWRHRKVKEAIWETKHK
ncbi:hypothetical protein MTR67_034648, partial [Solanum verrucosum]